MTLEEIKNLIENLRIDDDYFVVQYTTKPLSDTTYNFEEDWVWKSFSNIEDAKNFFDEAARHYYNVWLMGFTEKGSTSILDSVD